ncbi:DUF6518 family protein [Actinomadura rupiterrae]|uniref:DUF6518 family protein n=1 Tax=Actinomadura rupiterrae TaxID=559627 RepID=UPI0020A3A3C8|nr:DUF6518 family protein [Actinomadura rupiterrae]MCP2342761.1 hypothetical protein [Actinomadura rupiterrae]
MLASDQVPSGRHPASVRTALAFLAAALVGMGAGALTFGLERLDDAPPWTDFWRGLAPWGVVAVLVGASFPGRWRAAAVAGAITQLGLVAGYYTIESVSLGTVSGELLKYTVVGVVAGPLYGSSGAALRGRRRAVRTVASGIVAAPWLTDGSRTFLDDVTDSGSALAVATGVLLIGAVLPFALNHTLGTRLAGLVAAVLTAWLLFTMPVT